MLKQHISQLWNIALQVMKISLPIGEYNIQFWQLFIFGMIVTLLLNMLFRAGESN